MRWGRALFILPTFFVLSLCGSPSEVKEINRPYVLRQIAGTETDAKRATQVPFQTVAKGSLSGVREPSQVIIRSQAKWLALWHRHTLVDTNPAPAPVINFDKEIVAAVFLGEKPTGGYSVEIIRAEQMNGSLLIEYREKSPPPSSMTIQALTQPFHIIRLATNESLTATFRRTP
jgi:hypothetical protein